MNSVVEKIDNGPHMNSYDKIATIFIRIVNRLSDFTGYFAVVWLIGIALAVLAEIGSRLVTGKSLVWEYEAVTYALPVLIFSALVYTQKTKAHISVTLLTERLSDWQKNIWLCVIYLARLIFLIPLTWWYFIFTGQSIAILEIGTGAWAPPIYPIKIICAICLVLLILQVSADLISALRKISEQRSPQTKTGRLRILLASLI